MFCLGPEVAVDIFDLNVYSCAKTPDMITITPVSNDDINYYVYSGSLVTVLNAFTVSGCSANDQ